jgi:hypothetical protein
MAAQASKVVKVECVTRHDGVKRLRKAYHRLWQFSVAQGKVAALASAQTELSQPAPPAIQGGKP